MTVVETLISPLRPAVATLLEPASISSVYSLGAAAMIAFAWLALRRLRRNRRVAPKALMRAIFSRRVLLHRSTVADLAYCVIGLATLGAIIGWAVVSTSWISDGVAAFLARWFGPGPEPHAPDFVLDAARTLALFLAYDLGFFIDHSLKHRIPALWELHKAHHSAEVLTPLVNFRVHPLNSLILANNLALVIGLIGGVAQYALGRRAVSFTPVRPERADARLHLFDRSAPAQRDLDPVHRVVGPRVHEPRAPPASPFRRSGAFQL